MSISSSGPDLRPFPLALVESSAQLGLALRRTARHQSLQRMRKQPRVAAQSGELAASEFSPSVGRCEHRDPYIWRSLSMSSEEWACRRSSSLEILKTVAARHWPWNLLSCHGTDRRRDKNCRRIRYLGKREGKDILAITPWTLTSSAKRK